MNDLPEDFLASESALIARLEAERPTPAPGFRGQLGRAVVVEAKRRRVRARPEHLWWRVGALCAAGATAFAAVATQL